jgi:hypothetical protein
MSGMQSGLPGKPFVPGAAGAPPFAHPYIIFERIHQPGAERCEGRTALRRLTDFRILLSVFRKKGQRP